MASPIKADFSNEMLKDACLRLHTIIVRDLNCEVFVLDYLFGKKVLSANDVATVVEIPSKTDKCRRFMNILHKSRNTEAFIQFHQALQNDETHRWIANEIEKPRPDERQQLLEYVKRDDTASDSIITLCMRVRG